MQPHADFDSWGPMFSNIGLKTIPIGTDYFWPAARMVRSKSPGSDVILTPRRNVKQQRAHFPPTSISSILGPTPNVTVSSATIRPNGAAVIKLTSNVVYSYDASLYTWAKVTDGWFAEGSSAWQGRQRVNAQVANRGIVSSLESYVNEVAPSGEIDAEKERPSWWSVALTLGHLETRLYAAKALDSPQEYKSALALYARKIADEGFRAKAEELVKDLFGPTYWYVCCPFSHFQLLTLAF